ncbi:VIT1/CCC1 transporter family protein [Halorubellus sp. PRR65]|uniref:VIT1/CCC1 transporter family protein n=1 Tax=Halorubellus sp. PRR65 TaxID=3098148 RepID=UPI002B25C6D5|nr:VIT1/CCC1 transporter family protein [Halorubellus sp. PRR65]
MSRRARLRAVLADEDVRALSRRYFVSNGFDGTLTSVGVVVGAYLSGITDGATVFAIGAGGAVGLGTSGVWSVWEIERAETRADRLRVEAAMLRELDDTVIARRNRTARAVSATMSGIGPIVGVLVPLLPFLAPDDLLDPLAATALAVALGVALLFTFGAYLGALSEQSWVVAGARMGLAGIVVAALNILLGG